MHTAVYTRIKSKFKRVPFNDILYIEANRNYSEIYTTQGQKITICSNLSLIESKLPESLFSRVHRSYIVAIHQIDEFDHNSIWIAKQEIPLSKGYFESLTKQLITLYSENTKKQQGDIDENSK